MSTEIQTTLGYLPGFLVVNNNNNNLKVKDRRESKQTSLILLYQDQYQCPNKCLSPFQTKTSIGKVKEMNDKQKLKQKEMLLTCSQGFPGD